MTRKVFASALTFGACLCALFAGGWTSGVYSPPSHRGQAPDASSWVILEGADSAWRSPLEPSAELVNAARPVTPRLLVEYADAASCLISERSEGLVNAATPVTPRLLVEYADAGSCLISERSEALGQAAAVVPARVVLEYADAALTPKLESPATTPTPTSTATPVPTPTSTATPLPAPPLPPVFGTQVSYARGWNIVAGPAGTTFTSAGATLYTYQGATYTTLRNTQGVTQGYGYWAYFPSDATVTMNGAGADSYTTTLGAGQMKLVGNPSGLKTATVKADVIYTYDPASGYTRDQGSATLPVGRGAWVYSAQGGTVTVKTGQATAPGAFEPFAFAIITDLHVGRGFQDYGAPGWYDYNLTTGKAVNDNEGGSNYITHRLEAVVKWLKANHAQEKIKFLVILGDIADTGEASEFFRAKKILDNLEIPYIPVIGNHDVWSYVGELTCVSITRREGEFFFEKIFWSESHNKKNIDRVKSLFGNSWKRQEEMPGFNGAPYLQNYAFTYKEMDFVALDYARRDLNCLAWDAEVHPETAQWRREQLQGQRGKTVIVFSHHPHMKRGGFLLGEDYLADTAAQIGAHFLNFGGHIHYVLNVNEVYKEDTRAPVIVTKGMMGKTGELQEREDADFLRIVMVNGKNVDQIDYEKIVTIR